MRNTVHSAQAAFDHFDARHPGAVSLAHARFMLGDRAENDQLLLQSFGKDSTQETRRGRLVIATQVAEQSLDVDFDEMFSDLAPVDSLLQRAGRKCRHRRDAQGNPATVDSRATGPLYVLMPPDVDGERFMAELPFGTAYVYPMPGVLLRTAQIVSDWQSLAIPNEVRRAVEFAYDTEASVPSHLERVEAQAQGKTLAASQHARISQLRLPCGYSVEAGIDCSANSVTRLGEPSVKVVLCDGTGRPLQGTNNDGRELSQISLRASLIGKPEAVEGIVHLRMKQTALGNWCADVYDRRQKPFTARYTRARGFSMEPD
jgi:CRISPR-associated endonuclease/helicase Cas3